MLAQTGSSTPYPIPTYTHNRNWPQIEPNIPYNPTTTFIYSLSFTLITCISITIFTSSIRLKPSTTTTSPPHFGWRHQLQHRRRPSSSTSNSELQIRFSSKPRPPTAISSNKPQSRFCISTNPLVPSEPWAKNGEDPAFHNRSLSSIVLFGWFMSCVLPYFIQFQFWH